MANVDVIRSKRGKATVGIWQRMTALSLRLEPYPWILPAVGFFAIFIAYPVYFSFRVALFDWSGLTPIAQMKWVGLENYRELVRDDVFRLALSNSVVYATVTTMVFCILAFLLSFALWYRAPRSAGFLRSLIFYPSVLSSVIIALAWFKMYALDGLINGVLSGVLSHPIRTMWLSNVSLAFWAVMWVDIWKNTGWTMVLYLAGMSAVSPELVEGALVEGANSWQLARHIVEPLVRHVTGLALLLNIIGGLQVFGPIWVMTQGGPLHRTEVLSTYGWWLAFSRYGPSRLSYAATVSSVGVTILFVLAAMRLRARKVTV